MARDYRQVLNFLLKPFLIGGDLEEFLNIQGEKLNEVLFDLDEFELNLGNLPRHRCVISLELFSSQFINLAKINTFHLINILLR